MFGLIGQLLVERFLVCYVACSAADLQNIALRVQMRLGIKAQLAALAFNVDMHRFILIQVFAGKQVTERLLVGVTIFRRAEFRDGTAQHILGFQPVNHP